MGFLAAYSLYSGIFLLAGYLIYKWIMAGEKQYTLNRGILLCIYALSFAAWPLTHLSARGVEQDMGTAVFEGLELVAVAQASVPFWPKLLLAVYLAGCIAVFAWTLCVGVRLAILISGGRHQDCGPYTLVLLSGAKVAPFSWGRYIVMTEDDYESAGEMIIAHEAAHLRLGHSYDLLFAQLVCVLMWYNPAAWLMRDELATLHEFQADKAVIDSGVNIREYQMLLIKKAAGTRFQSLANSLNHSKLKKRVTMMYKEKNRGLRRLRGLVLGMAPLAALAVVNIPAVASAIGSLGAASLYVSAESKAAEGAPDNLQVVAAGSMPKVSENPADVKTDSVFVVSSGTMRRASFPGGDEEMYRYLANNVKYPAEAAQKNIQGRAVIRFTVGADGELSDFSVVKSAGALLDQEAVRVIASMPKWEPAMSDGLAVASSYVVPVSFKLQEDAKEAVIKIHDVSEVKEKRTKDVPVILIENGVAREITRDELNDIPHMSIESIEVKKADSHYTDGMIVVTLK